MFLFCVLMLLFGGYFIIMGIYYLIAKNPRVANLYANTNRLIEADIIDKKAYNSICGKIFILWGTLNSLIGIVSNFMGDYFIFVLILIPITNIIMMAMYNTKATKYIRREKDC